MNATKKIVRKIAILLIIGYQKIVSPFFPGTCRFYPTCSEYGIQAIEEHGIVKGTVLLTFRLLRCQPLCKGGIDLVPEHSKTRRR